MRYLITGATGFIGGHAVDACLQRGHSVSVLVRESSAAAGLEKQGAALHRGDLSDIGFLRHALSDVDVVVHCAAKVGDWGPLEDYRRVNVEQFRTLLEACKGQALTRFVHISSLGVYSARNHYGTDESVSLPTKHRDGYSQSKVEAESVALSYYRDFGVPVVILRPGFVYGPRDRAVMPRLIDNLRKGTVRYPGGKGKRALNTIFVRNLVDAIFLAVERDQAVGQIYNLTDGEAVSKRRFCDAVADAMGLPRATLTPPYWLAWVVTWCCDRLAKLRGAKEAPAFNFTRLKFMGLNLDFGIEKAKMELGYRPRVTFDDAMHETMAWYKENYPLAS